MSSTSIQAIRQPRQVPLRTWRLAAGLVGVAAGAAIVAGAFLPWVQAFAGLIQISGLRGSNGRTLDVAGVLLAAAGLYHAVSGGPKSRWLVGVGGFAALGFSGYLLVRLTATMNTLGGNSMVIARGGPGLWVTAAGALLAFGTLFLPASSAALPSAGPRPRPAALVRADAIWSGVASWAADLESTGARRRLQVALGLVWLVDAILQFQPYMFGSAFVTRQLEPTAMGNPAVIASPAMWASRLILHDVAAWNAAFAVIQLVIAVGLLWRPAVRAALAASVLWSLAVWWLGEGLGGVLTGTASPVTGAPGAVILYALVAVLVWPRRSRGAARPGGQAQAGFAAELGGSWRARAAWVLLWGSFAYLILQGPVRAPRALHDAIAGGAAGQPGWLAGLDRAVATAAGSHGTAICIALAAAFVFIAAGAAFPATARPALLLAIVAGLACWVAGENFGGVLTGQATDVSTGPLLVMLAAVCWPRRPKAAPGRPFIQPGRAAPAAGEYDAPYVVN
jgi:hypothetical protein